MREGAISALNNKYTFTHDRIQQAAYSLISEADKKNDSPANRKTIAAKRSRAGTGRKHFRHCQSIEYWGGTIKYAGGKNGSGQTEFAGREKEQKRPLPYPSSVEYLRAGIALLAENHWQIDYALSFDLYLGRAESEFLCSNFPIAEPLSDELLKRATSDEDTFTCLSPAT